MSLRVRGALLLVPFLAGAAAADVYWFTSATGTVHHYDSDPGSPGFGLDMAPAGGPLGPVTIAPGLPATTIDPLYAITAPYGIDSLRVVSGIGDRLIFVDDPFVCVVDTDPASATYNMIIQTVSMVIPGMPADTPGLLFPKLHNTGSKFYVTGLGGTGALPSIRVAFKDIVTGLYKFDPLIFPGHLQNNATGGEWIPLDTDPFLASPDSGVHTPFGLDVSPDGTKVYWACHSESVGFGHSSIHFFTIDAAGEPVASGDVSEPVPPPPPAFPIIFHPFLVNFSPNLSSFAIGGSRCYVTCNGDPDAIAFPFAPAAPPIGFVTVVSLTGDIAKFKVDAGITPPTYGDPATGLPPLDPLTMEAFFLPRDVSWTSGVAIVSDLDLPATPPATDGIIGAFVFQAIAPSFDATFLYLTDPDPGSSATPVHWGNAIDNDDQEVVFCNIGSPPGVVSSLNLWDLAGVSIASVPTPGLAPRWIVVQAGTGVPPGSGGGYNDNGAEIPDEDDDGHSKGRPRCFVASASWGRGSVPVRDLVAFRSSSLHGAQAGRVFDRMYYGFGPSLASGISASGAGQAGRVVLAPFALAARGGVATGSAALALLVILVAMAVRRMR